MNNGEICTKLNQIQESLETAIICQNWDALKYTFCELKAMKLNR